MPFKTVKKIKIESIFLGQKKIKLIFQKIKV